MTVLSDAPALQVAWMTQVVVVQEFTVADALRLHWIECPISGDHLTRAKRE